MTTSDYLTQLQQDREDLVDNLETKGITGLTGDETFTELVPEVLNIPSGSNLEIYNCENFFQNGVRIEQVNDIAPYLKPTSALRMFQYATNLINAPDIDYSNCDNLNNMFAGCSNLETIPTMNLSLTQSIRVDSAFASCPKLVTSPLPNGIKVNNVATTFYNCQNLENIGTMDMSDIVGTSYVKMFNSNVTKLTTTSLDNLLLSLLTASINVSGKTLYNVFNNANMSSYYPASTIEALPHYQDFVNAGWSIGW